MHALDSLHIDMRGCKWHFLESFRRRCRLMKIRQDVCNEIVRICRLMYYAPGRAAFGTLYADLKRAAPVAFVEYFRSTWLGDDVDYPFASRWCQSLGFISSFNADLSASAQVLEELQRQDTNNIAESLNAADRRLFNECGKKGILEVYQQLGILQKSMDGHYVRYQDARKNNPGAVHAPAPVYRQRLREESMAQQ